MATSSTKKPQINIIINLYPCHYYSTIIMNYGIITIALLIVASGAALILPCSLLSKLRKKEDTSEIGIEQKD